MWTKKRTPEPYAVQFKGSSFIPESASRLFVVLMTAI